MTTTTLCLCGGCVNSTNGKCGTSPVWGRCEAQKTWLGKIDNPLEFIDHFQQLTVLGAVAVAGVAVFCLMVASFA